MAGTVQVGAIRAQYVGASPPPGLVEAVDRAAAEHERLTMAQFDPVPAALSSVDDVVGFWPRLVHFAAIRDQDEDPRYEAQFARLFGSPRARGEPFPRMIRPAAGSLPDLSGPPADGWSSSTPKVTARLASVAMAAEMRLADAQAVAADPSAQARAAAAARDEVDQLAGYLEVATSNLGPSSAPWLTLVRDWQRTLPPPPGAIPLPSTDRRPITGYQPTPVTLT